GASRSCCSRLVLLVAVELIKHLRVVTLARCALLRRLVHVSVGAPTLLNLRLQRVKLLRRRLRKKPVEGIRLGRLRHGAHAETGFILGAHTEVVRGEFHLPRRRLGKYGVEWLAVLDKPAR